MIDFHSHFLPGIDDGPYDSKDSVSLLSALKEQGVDAAVATPHYYDRLCSIDSFLEKRESAYVELTDIIKKENVDVPEIFLGAEVYLSPDVASDKKLDRLCIGNTRCILLEMPNGFWFDWVYDSINKIKTERDLIPIIAHIERYSAEWPYYIKPLEKLLEMDVLVQVNTASCRYGRMWRVVKKLFVQNKVHLLGTDSHNLTTRKPEFKTARRKIIKKFGQKQWDILCENASALLAGKQIKDDAKMEASRNGHKKQCSNAIHNA